MNEQEQILYMQARLSRLAGERWGKTPGEVMQIFAGCHVLEYIEDSYGIFHVQGDEANMEDIEEYIGDVMPAEED